MSAAKGGTDLKSGALVTHDHLQWQAADEQIFTFTKTF